MAREGVGVPCRLLRDGPDLIVEIDVKEFPATSVMITPIPVTMEKGDDRHVDLHPRRFRLRYTETR